MNRIKNHTLLVILCTALAANTLTGCDALNKNKTINKSGYFFDTIITITLYGTDKADPIDGCFALADKYEKMLSNTIEGSEISQINALAGSGTYYEVSDDTLALIQDGIEYASLSEGVFDITLGTLSNLWNISEIAVSLESDTNEADESLIPSDDAIAEALSTVGYDQIEISGNQVRLTNSSTTLDLGGIAKGFIADQMKEYLVKECGIRSAIINLGGNVLTIGNKPDGSDFGIGIQKPFANGEIIGGVKVSDKSVVSSGIYERYFRVGDDIYHHLLDLNTGYPCKNNLYGVSIISDSSMDGDALSTTCYLLGPDKGMKLIESLDNTEAIFVTDQMELICSSGAKKLLMK